MKIIKSHITYEEVKKTREELNPDANIRTEIKEETIHLLKRLPFFIIFVKYGEFIFRYSSKGLTMKEKHILSKRMVEKLHDSGELDFTLIDEKWNELLEKYEIN